MSTLCPVCNGNINDEAGICPNCGFKLMESTQSFQPVPISSQELTSSTEQDSQAAVLRIIRGPQIEAFFVLSQPSYTIGRNPQNEIFLNDMTVSRQHASVKQVDSGYKIEDLNSFNGVWVNNNSIDSHLLQDGDIIQIGAFCLLYQENNPS